MKVRKRTVPLDAVSVEQKDRLITIHTHRHTISFSAYEKHAMDQVAWHEFTFDQLFQLLKNLKPGIADICTPP